MLKFTSLDNMNTQQAFKPSAGRGKSMSASTVPMQCCSKRAVLFVMKIFAILRRRTMQVLKMSLHCIRRWNNRSPHNHEYIARASRIYMHSESLLHPLSNGVEWSPCALGLLEFGAKCTSRGPVGRTLYVWECNKNCTTTREVRALASAFLSGEIIPHLIVRQQMPQKWKLLPNSGLNHFCPQNI